MAASESVRFDLIGQDHASDAFSRVGRAAGDMGGKMDAAATASSILDEALKRQRETTQRTADATLTLAKTDKILSDSMKLLTGDAEIANLSLREMRRELDRLDGKTVNIKVDVDRSSLSRARSVLGTLLGGAGRGAAGLGGLGGQGISGGLGTIPFAGGSPYAAAGILAAAVASAPFLGQILGGGLVTGLGGGLAGLGIAGALMTGKAPKGVTAAQLTAAQDRLAAAQAAQAALGRKATPGQIASAAGSVVSAQGSLSALQAQSAASAQFAAENRLQLQTKAAFANLADSAKDSLASIGRSFVPVMKRIFDTAHDVLGTLTPVFAAAVKAISGPFAMFADVLVRTFARTDVKNSIADVAKAFGAILTAVTPVLASAMGNIAVGISKIAQAVSANPQALANFVQFFFQVAGAALTAIAWLTKVANYIEAHFRPAMHRVAVIFDGVRHDIAHTWDQIWNNSIGMVIRLAHDVERDFNDFRHRTAVVFDGIRGDIAHYWDMTFSNTIGRIQRGFHDVAVLFDRGRHDIAAGFGKLPGEMLNIGKAAVGQLWAGMKSIAGTIVGWVKGFAKNVLDVLHLGWLIKSPSGAMYSIGKNLMLGLLHGIQDHGHLVRSALGASVGAAAAGAVGGAPGQVQALARTMAAARGWTGLLWDALNAVEMREAGWQLGAVNPTSGAYGIAQFINGPAEYYQFGGNPGTAAGQITGFLNYVAQRYANPLIALGHEQRFGWYDQGGFLPPGLSLAYNTTGRPEPVGAARGTTYVINVAVSPLARPADTGREVVAAIREHEKRAGRGWRTP